MVQAAKLIGAGSAQIAQAGVGAGIGIVFGAQIQAASRNPTMAKALMGYALLGFALCESVALFAQLVTFLILFGSPLIWSSKQSVSFAYLEGILGISLFFFCGFFFFAASTPIASTSIASTSIAKLSSAAKPPKTRQIEVD